MAVSDVDAREPGCWSLFQVRALGMTDLLKRKVGSSTLPLTTIIGQRRRRLTCGNAAGRRLSFSG